METISIIIPCYNEEEAIPVYYETMVRQMNEMEEQQKVQFELIFVDDGSRDHSLFVTVEENVKSGGYGEHVSAYMEACHPEIRVLSAAVWDRFVPQGNVESLRSRIGLGVEDIRQAIEDSEELREQ